MKHSKEHYIEQTKQWINAFVVAYNLCPFAKREMDKGSVRIHCSGANTLEAALLDLQSEIALLDSNEHIETSFLLFHTMLQDFFDFLDFADQAEIALKKAGYEGIYQIATFHPEYCFADANCDDVSNYTNRSPYPMLHLLRESSVEKAIAYFGNTGTIPETNIRRLRGLGLELVQKIIQDSLSLTKS